MPPKGFEQNQSGTGRNEPAWWQSASPGPAPIIEPDDDDMYWFAFWLGASIPLGALIACVLVLIVAFAS